MRIHIEEYRGWDIYFNTQTEEFYTISNEYEKQVNKKSFSAAKKYVDDFIKDNINFERVTVVDRSGREIDLIGVRKDGAFMCIENGGEPKQFSKYDESSFFVKHETHSLVFEQVREIEKEKKRLDKQIQELRDGLIKTTTVSELRKKWTS